MNQSNRQFSPDPSTGATQTPQLSCGALPYFEDEELQNWNIFCFTHFEEYFGPSNTAHKLDHALRVLRTAFWLSTEFNNTDKIVLLISCYFHDARALPKNNPHSHTSPHVSAEHIGELFGRTNLSIQRIHILKEIILSHSYSSTILCETPESMLLSDADKLDALGAIGIARLFSTAGSLGTKLYDFEDPFAESRELNDNAFALDHFYQKIVHLPERMHSQKARKLAVERLSVVKTFIETLRIEILTS